LSKFLSKLHCTITAIDISPEMLYYFKKNLASKIKKDKIKTIEGNAEEIHKFVRSVDKIIVACAFWDMYTKSLLRNVSKIMDKKSELIFNLPALTIDEEKGVIYFFENSFRQEFPKANLYRRIDLTDLQNELNKNGLKFRKIIPYSFYLQKNSIQYFFKVLRVRYPFIFLPDIPYNKAVKICDKIFTKALDKTSKRGIKEEGKIFVIGKK